MPVDFATQTDRLMPPDAAQFGSSVALSEEGEVNADAKGSASVAAKVLRDMRYALKTGVMALYVYSGFVALRDAILSALGRSRVIVVYYHRIGEPDVLTRSRSEFVRDLEYFKRHYECLSLRELCHRLKAGKWFRRRAVVISFDDGYRDNFTEAAPALRAAGLTATFFVSTGFVGTGKEFSHDQRRDSASGNHGRNGYPKLTWADLRTMEALGFEIGSHTINHTNLGDVGLNEMQAEISGSLEALNEELGREPRSFSFPWGKPADISKAAIEAVQKAGYYSACSAYGGSNTSGTNPLNIKRVDVGNGHLSRLAFRAKVAGFDPDYYRVRLGIARILKFSI